jgi:hypothetical protein
MLKTHTIWLASSVTVRGFAVKANEDQANPVIPLSKVLAGQLPVCSQLHEESPGPSCYSENVSDCITHTGMRMRFDTN